jgi:hypothetical protein
MKIMRKIFLILTISLFGSTAFSQGSGIWNFQWDMGFGVGETGDFVGQYSLRGFALEGRGYVTENLTVGGRWAWDVFYENYGWKTETSNDGQSTVYGYSRHYMNAMPIMVTGHYTFNSNKFIPYIGLGLGTYYIETRNMLGIYYIEQDAWHFGLAPEAGIIIPFGKTSNWGLNLNVRYNWAAKTKDEDQQTWINTSVGFSYFW